MVEVDADGATEFGPGLEALAGRLVEAGRRAQQRKITTTMPPI